MVSAGDNSLEQYMFELEDAFLAFQEQYGLPDHRVAILSLRDDVLAIPRVDVSQRAHFPGGTRGASARGVEGPGAH